MGPSDTGVLELEKLKEVLAAYAVSTSGKHRIGSMGPFEDLAAIEAEHRACAEMIAIERSPQPFPAQGLRDVQVFLDRLSRGSVLDAAAITELRNHLRVARRVRTFLVKIEADTAFPEIARRSIRLRARPQLEERIDQTISPDGDILDSASGELRRIRVELRRSRSRIQDRLESILSNPRYDNVIQERVITIRNGRYVIPVKQDFRGKIRGLFQGQSSSGATVFLEPLAVVETNNALHRLLAEEQDEISRVLAELSDLLREELENLQANADVLAELDFLRAKARFSLDYRCCPPKMVDRACVDLRGARHPLLEYHFRQEHRANPETPLRRVVPTDIALDAKTQGLIITGPNTGGKTIVLKTVGLLALMAQSGMPVPAEPGTTLGVFDAICADIGDEQSIEQNLSTFSSHMTRVIRIVRQATPRTLVLLDEIGAGTDPTEGAALATAILDELVRRGALVLVTTHHGALKAYAHSHVKLRNASMSFDEKTLLPTYRLHIGVPGSSHALRIADQLGMPEAVLSSARERIGDRAVEMETLITDIERVRREMVAEQKALRDSLAQAEAMEREYSERAAELRAHKQALRRKAEEEAEVVLRDARGLVERTIAELRRTNASKDAIQRAHRDLAEARRRQTERRAEERLRAVESLPALSVGDVVYLKEMRMTGEVIEPPTGNAGMTRVRVGAMTLNLPATDLELPKEDAEKKSALPKRFQALASEKKATISQEFDVRGLRVYEALDRVDKFLDDAMLAGLERVWVIHGKGTGALRQALHDHLRDHPHVATYRLGTHDEGDAGVTVVDLRE